MTPEEREGQEEMANTFGLTAEQAREGGKVKTMHIFEIDDAMLGSEWSENDSRERFMECLAEAFAQSGIDASIRWADSCNGGRGMICPDDETCPHYSERDIDSAWQDALAAYAAERYVKKGGVECPFCGSNDIEGGEVAIDAGGATQEVSCLECGESWYDLYALTGYLPARR